MTGIGLSVFYFCFIVDSDRDFLFLLVQFCKHLQDLSDARNLTMANLPHPPGEQTYIDFAGKYAEYVDPGTGQIHQVPVLLLGHSQYSYVEAIGPRPAKIWSMESGAVFRLFSEVTKILIPDNMKTAVVKTDRYEPGINRLIQNGMATATETEPCGPDELPDHKNIRGKTYFQQSLNLT